MTKIIVVNSGSTSKKYGFYEGDKLVLSFHFEKEQNHEFVLNVKKEGNFDQTSKIDQEIYEKAFSHLVSYLLDNHFIESEAELGAAIFRVVAPGTYFTEDREIDADFLDRLDEIHDQAPLHIEKMKSEFSQVTDRLPNLKLISISDSRFHKDKPEVASMYALPEYIVNELDIRKFGYHGISVSSVINKIKLEREEVPEKIIVCHLGGGSSITAIKNGQSIENSMGYSPLEGLPMATRIGNIDAGAIISIADRMDLEMSEIRDILYYKSGLKGVSGGTDDVRDLLEKMRNHDPKATLALDLFTYNIKKTISAYFGILGGLDLLVFTGTIGERSRDIRNMVCKDLSCLGIEIDDAANLRKMSEPGFINKPGSMVSVEVIHTEEEKEIATRSLEYLEKLS